MSEFDAKEQRPYILAASLIPGLMLLGALGSWPYGYYQSLRWVACIGAIYLAFVSYSLKNKLFLICFIGLGILFNPIAPVFMSKESWSTYDVIASFIFIVYGFIALSSGKRQ